MNLQFAHPELVAAGVLCALAALWFARRRGRARETAYLDLWEKALTRTSWLERLAQRLPDVQTLCLAAAALGAGAAAASPSRTVPGPRNVIFALDRSASMAACDTSGRSRLERGAQALAERITNLRPGDRVAVVALGLGLETVVSPSTDHAAAARAVRAIELEPVDTDLRGALEPLAALGANLVVATDGAGRKADALAARSGLQMIAIGEPVSNAGIVDLEVQDSFPESTVSITVVVAGDEGARASRTLRVLREDGTEAARSEIPKGGGEVPLQIAIERRAGGRLRTELTPPDGFPLDDCAELLVRAPAQWPIVAVLPDGGSPFLRAVATATAKEWGLEVLEARSAEDAPPEAVLLQDGGSLAALPKRGVLWGVHISGVTESAQGAGAVVRVHDHAITRGLSFAEILATPKIAFRSDDGALVEGAIGSLVSRFEDGDRRVLATTFRLSESNLPVLGGTLPVMVRRALLWIAAPSQPVIPFVRTGRDPQAPLRGAPIDGPRRLGPCELPEGRSVASFLRRTSLAPGALPRGAPAQEGAPVATPLTAPCLLLALGAAALWILLELLPAAASRRRSDGMTFLPISLR